MAKKNSSKTATEKAIQSSEPRLLAYKGWKGVNYVDSALTWEPLEEGPNKFRQDDLPMNFLMVQNNLNTTPLLGIETRDDSIAVGRMPYEDISNGYKFTGVSAIYRHWIFHVFRSLNGNSFLDRIYYRSLLDNDTRQWTIIDLIDPDEDDVIGYSIDEIGFYEGQMVATAHRNGVGKVFLAKTEISSDGQNITINGMDWTDLSEDQANKLVATPYIEDPIGAPTLKVIGMESSPTEPDLDDDETRAVVRVEVVYCYTNRMGSTLVSNPATVYTEYSPALWSSSRYVNVKPPSGGIDPMVLENSGISGVDFYARDTENTDYVFVGHVDIDYRQTTAQGTPWSYNWLGNMSDISQWMNSQLQIPSENNTMGPNVSHFASHDSRIYYWGQPDKLYRLYIGGNPGAEFSVARGLGGAWVDIEPGSGFEIAGTAKWKTVQGANIVTIMCGNRNTNKVKRFNLVETNLTITNEISYKGYMYEEVSNVVGCNSRYGYGVFGDGLYSLSRYGLMLTTMAMEYNSQMRNQNVSEAIKPIFTDRDGWRLRDGRMVCIDDVIYIALSEDTKENEPTNLDNVILCYDIGLQAWYTWTHDQRLGRDMGGDPDKIHHIFAIDSDEFIEGLGVVTDTEVRLYPTTGIQEPTVPDFEILLETGELMPKSPKQVFNWIEQLEFRFDYLVGDPTDPAEIRVEGVDYYGRQFVITKKINVRSRGNHGLEGEQRDYIEWIRVNKLVESLRIRIKGRVRFRLTHINNKLYTHSDRIGTPYGYDARDQYHNRRGDMTEIHHYINDYNNLRRAIVS